MDLIAILMEYRPLVATIGGLLFLLVLILRWRVDAFAALLLASVLTALGGGLGVDAAYQTVIDGVGGTLGFIAVVIGLGALFGALLEATGVVERAAAQLVGSRKGDGNTAWVLAGLGVMVAIPIFFDVALIILAPAIIALARRTNRPAIYWGLPLLAGLATAHAFIPPTPGPIAVAEIIGAEMGWVIVFGFGVGAVSVAVAGPILLPILRRVGAFSKLTPPSESSEPPIERANIGLLTVVGLISFPLVLIVSATLAKLVLPASGVTSFISIIGHPFMALLLACGLVFVVVRDRTDHQETLIRKGIQRAFEPTGAVILVTGAGGAFKQVLVNTGAGAQLADGAALLNLTPLVAAYVMALLVRAAQGSATVSMITAAGLVAPLIGAATLSPPQVALVGVAIASGATGLSHVNDSGFWLVSRIFGVSALETLKTWTVVTTILSVTAFALAVILYSLV